MRLLQYAWQEAVSSIWRGRRSSFLSTATIAIALFVLGAFLVVTSNLERLAEEWSGAAEMSVYLADSISGADRAAIERELNGEPSVASVEYVEKTAALRRFQATFPDLAQTMQALDRNPLPASLDVRLQSSSAAQAAIDSLVQRMRSSAGVTDVRYDKEWLDRLLQGVRVLRSVGFALGGALILAAALTITNVVRLALAARHDELEIMHLVGAPRSFVRGPFVMEGALHGGGGALAAVLVLGLVFVAIRTRLLVPIAAMLNLSSVHFLPIGLALLMIAGGTVVGCVAGLVASRRA